MFAASLNNTKQRLNMRHQQKHLKLWHAGPETGLEKFMYGVCERSVNTSMIDSRHKNNVTAVFVEVEEWEHEKIACRCSYDCRVSTRSGRLEQVLDDENLSETTILSTSVNSHVGINQLNLLPNLRFIATRSADWNHIDMKECARRGITVSNVPRYGEHSAAEHAFSLLLALSRKTHRCHEQMIGGNFSIQDFYGTNLFGKTFGALGTGNISRKMLQIANGFDMRRIACDVDPKPELAEKCGFKYVGFDRLMRESDVLAVYVPYNRHTHHLIDENDILKMRKDVIIVDISRGEVISPRALFFGLTIGLVKGVGLDILDADALRHEKAEIKNRPFYSDSVVRATKNNNLIDLPNVVITPQIAFKSTETTEHIIRMTFANIHAFLDGQAKNVVNPESTADSEDSTDKWAKIKADSVMEAKA